MPSETPPQSRRIYPRAAKDCGGFEIDQSEERSVRIRVRSAQPAALGGRPPAPTVLTVQDRNGVEAGIYVPTSVQLSKMLDRAGDSHVSVGWLMEQLAGRSFGLTLVVMAVIAFLPGASTIVGVLVAWPAVQMVLGHEGAVLPRFIARRKIPVDRLAAIVRTIRPRLAWIERLIRPRWPPPFQITKRLTGIVMLLLGLTMALPVPFGQVVPALVIMLLALAYLEEDGIALLIALIAALASLAITTATVWGTVETVDWLDPARPK